MEITFLGATGTVTGSRYLLSYSGRRILVDCGLFQGLKQLRLRNWEPFPVNPETIDAVVLTHAHLDHSGYLPLLVRSGFSGPIYCTPGTKALCQILLRDSGHLQEEEAAQANRYGYSKHHPALALYTEHDAVVACNQLEAISVGEPFDLGAGLSARFHTAGHILGAAMVELRSPTRSVLFTGDLGRPSDPLLLPPAIIREADFLVLESTYGNRRHAETDPLDELAMIIGRTAGRGGALLIPSFAVGRAQQLLFYLHQLRETHRIPWLPIYLDSPMATRATDVFRTHADEHRLTSEDCDAVCSVAEVVESVPASKLIDQMQYPRIIISASGMATGGRVLHHLKALAPDPRNTILFVGFQAQGTRGAAMLAGAEAIKIHGEYIPVRAEVSAMESLSSHADYVEILNWLHHFERAPHQTFLTHGEPVAADALRRLLEERLQWNCRVPEYGETVSLGPALVVQKQPSPVSPAIAGNARPAGALRTRAPASAGAPAGGVL
jgi:metallo-beta-lactamase family protein